MASIKSSIIAIFSRSSNPTSTLPCHHNNNDLSSQASLIKEHSPNSDNYLLLVLPHMRHGLKVTQPTASWILSDYSFFKALGDHYRSSRGAFRRAISWRVLRELRFVRFEMFSSSLAQIQKYDDLPPPTMRDCYEYEPVEWTPPIHPQHMLHLIEHPDDAQRSLVLFKHVPKKLREKLAACPLKGRCDGWGIQYLEDVDQERVCFVVFLCAVVSLMLAVLWTVYRKDVQGGFTVGGTIFVLMTTGVGSLEMMVRGRDNVAVGGR